MEKIFVKARAKVNLTLNVLNKRDDGYHNLKSVFQKINFYDEMWVEKTEKNEFELVSNIKNVKVEDNIVYKAYLRLKNEFDFENGIKVTLNKKIPMQAGLAGGSTDAGAFVLAVNKLFKLNLTPYKIKEICSKLRRRCSSNPL